MRIVTIPILALSLCCVACAPAPPPEPPAKRPTVFDAQLKALDEAKAVQATIDRQKKEMDEKLHDAGG